MTKITYNGSTIADIEANEAKTLKCGGKVMKSDITIEGDDKAEISYNGEVIARLESGTVTLKCDGKKMRTNISIVTESAMETLATPTIELDGTTLNIYDEEGIATSYDILVDGVVMDSVEVSKGVNITLNAGIVSASGNHSVYVKFGSAPTSDDDYEYWSYTNSYAINIKGENYPNDSFNITVNPIAYIWGGNAECGYKINDGSSNIVGRGYANATEVQLSEGDTLTILSAYD